MKPGDVLLYRDFKFVDGSVHDKLLIILAPAPDNKVMFVLTTSQQHERDIKDGCHASEQETCFTFNANLAGFKTTTWVILKPWIMYERGLTVKMPEGRVVALHSLSDVNFRAVVNCFRKSEDVSPFHLSLLK